MGDFLTFDVVDRPEGGAARTHVALRRHRRPPGCRGLVVCTTSDLRATLVPRPRLRRLAVIGAWEDEAAADRSPVAALAAGALEHWHLRGELAKVTDRDPWAGWSPSADGAEPLRDDEPVFVLISGDLRARYWPPFIKANVGAVARAEEHPGYLGGLAAFSDLANTTSCSAWRSVADSRDYAYGGGDHTDAMRTDRAVGWHVTSRFLRIRPRASYGTLDGKDPFAGRLQRDAAVA